MKADILAAIDAVLAENRQIRRQRMRSHVLWLCDNPTQLPIKRAGWDHTTTAITDQDLTVSAMVADRLWQFSNPEQGAVCVRCCSNWVEGDRPFCDIPDCRPYGIDTASLEVQLPGFAAAVAGLPQPLHRGRVHIRPIVETL